MLADTLASASYSYEYLLTFVLTSYFLHTYGLAHFSLTSLLPYFYITTVDFLLPPRCDRLRRPARAHSRTSYGASPINPSPSADLNHSRQLLAQDATRSTFATSHVLYPPPAPPRPPTPQPPPPPPRARADRPHDADHRHCWSFGWVHSLLPGDHRAGPRGLRGQDARNHARGVRLSKES